MRSLVFGMVLLVGMAAALGAAQAQEGKGGGSPYASWKHGPGASSSYFPIAVWLQSPENAARYKAAGINLYIGLWQGPTEAQLAALKAAGMPVICEQNAVGLAHKDDPTIAGWMHGDEPDNAQPVTDPATGKTGYGPCIPPQRIVDDYKRLREKDPTRPVLLNLGQGVANDKWVGRGSGAKQEDYLTYVKGGDIVSFDVYPVAGLNDPKKIPLVGLGLDRLRRWSGGARVLWNCIECTHIGDEGTKPTPEQVRAEVWLSLIHGSRGLIYFVHQFSPSFNEHALLDDPPMLAMVTAVNRQIQGLAPVLNSPTVDGGASATTGTPGTPLELMVKRQGGATYLFACSLRGEPAAADLRLKGLQGSASAEVLGESRRVTLKDGAWQDRFEPYGAHIYRVK